MGIYAKQGTGINGGGYPVPGLRPNLPAVTIYWTGYDVSYLGGRQELIMQVQLRIIVADQQEAEKVIGQGDPFVAKMLDRFRPDRANPAYNLTLPGESGMVDHCRALSGGLVSQSIPGWGASFYGAEFPFEIKLHRDPQEIV